MNPWRVGKRVPINVYEGDEMRFMCRTPEDAARIVELLNASVAALDARNEEETRG